METIDLAGMNACFEALIVDAGYRVKPWRLDAADFEGRVAENDYFALVFQPFDTWAQLEGQVAPLEIEIASQMRHGTTKNWDAYLLMACQEFLTESHQFDEATRIQHDTRRLRKLVSWGAGESLARIDDLVRPFRALEQVHLDAKSRDPLQMMRDLLVERGEDPTYVARALALFREQGNLD